MYREGGQATSMNHQGEVSSDDSKHDKGKGLVENFLKTENPHVHRNRASCRSSIVSEYSHATAVREGRLRANAHVANAFFLSGSLGACLTCHRQVSREYHFRVVPMDSVVVVILLRTR
jgi:hypothetical protein